MKKLFVGNLPHSTTEAELRTLFEPHGKIDQVSWSPIVTRVVREDLHL